jgi:hypothetical protein
MEMGRVPDQDGNGVRGGKPGLNMTESGVEIYPTALCMICKYEVCYLNYCLYLLHVASVKQIKMTDV